MDELIIWLAIQKKEENLLHKIYTFFFSLHILKNKLEQISFYLYIYSKGKGRRY